METQFRGRKLTVQFFSVCDGVVGFCGVLVGLSEVTVSNLFLATSLQTNHFVKNHTFVTNSFMRNIIQAIRKKVHTKYYNWIHRKNLEKSKVLEL